MKLLRFNYRHLLKHDGKPQESNFIDPSTANIILSQVPRRPADHTVDFKTVQDFLSSVNHSLFYMIDSEGTDEFGVPVFKPSELLLLDFDEDTSWKTHEERLNAIESLYGLSVNGYYQTHSFNDKDAWKLRYVIRFDKAPTMEQYRDIMLFFACRFGMDKYTTGFGRRVYGSSTDSGVLLTEKRNNLDLFFANISASVTNYKDIARQEEAETLALVSKVADSFDSLPIVKEFMSLKTKDDLYAWAVKYHIEYDTDAPGRYMTFFQTIFNYSVFLGDDDRTDALVAKYVSLGGSQRTKLGKKNRIRDGRPQYYKYFAWKKMTRELEYKETNGLIDILENVTYIDKYLSVSQVYQFLSSASKQKLLVSTAGTGKTYTITKSLIENHHSFVFLMPTTAITNNQESKHLKMIASQTDANLASVLAYMEANEEFQHSKEYTEKVEELAGEHLDYIMSIKRGNDGTEELVRILKEQKTGFFHSKNPVTDDINEYDVVFATYDQFQRYCEKNNRIRDFLIVDEAHLLGQYQNISHDKSARLRKITCDIEGWNLFKKQVHCTATPFNLPDIYDEKKCFLSESKKSLELMYCDERLGNTKMDKPVFFRNVFSKLLSVKPEMFREKNGSLPKILVFSNLSKEELPIVSESCANVIGYDRHSYVTSATKDESEAYKHLVYGHGEMPCDILFATSILNTGVDIQGVFDYILFINSMDINALLQALHRDRSDDTKVIFFMQNKQFIPKVYSEEQGKMVNLQGDKLNISQTRYINYRWVESPGEIIKRAKSRNRHGDRIIHAMPGLHGQTMYINEPYFAQADYFTTFSSRYASPELISNCLTQLRVSHKSTYVGAVAFSDDDSKTMGDLVAEYMSDGSYVQPNDIPLEVLAYEIDQLRGLKPLGVNRQRIIRATYSEFTDTKEHKCFAKILKRFAPNPFYDEINSTVLAEAILFYNDVVYDKVTPEYIVEAVYQKISGQYGEIPLLIVENKDIDMTTDQMRHFLSELKSFITARNSNRISGAYVEKMLKDFGYVIEVPRRGFKKITKIC